ncbi:recombinase family protein [Nocardiopsis alborubida]|uniref:Recombinase family protein n=1 Tax=Nocardiopsis alborubida TaxID=146802 RepID=A0A7X6RSF2_9ACTN|nr:recombinase family protein [Nocardiopsis alborubida]NKZ00976.1 recombinase family protein [Nocardiopsis alborubida]
MAAAQQVDFAFLGRVSTEDQQDPESSRHWQRMRAETLIAPHGRIVAEYFDIDRSRSIPPQRRPEASRLLDSLPDPDRGFQAVVIGEPQRAFYGSQFTMTSPVFEHYGVQLWVPEIGGPIDPANEAHELIMSMYGGISKGERTRIKTRVRAAMAAQTLLEGRYLGGRPPYGYMLVDAGPHPNPAKAADGRRLHRLAPDPRTAWVVRRIFAEYLGGMGIFAIAEGLTRDGIPSPSAHDRKRNRHRSGIAWSKGAVRAILRNPRYTGHQVWAKQRKDEVLIDVNDVQLGHQTLLRWNEDDEWVWSRDQVHDPLITHADFTQAKALMGSRGRSPGGEHKTRRTRNPYLFRGAFECCLCDRRMQGQWSHGKAYYRCRFPEEYALANRVHHPRNVYLREADVVPTLDAWIAAEFAPGKITATVDALMGADEERGTGVAREMARLRERLSECDRKLAQHRAVLEAGADPVEVTKWMKETQAEKSAAEAGLARVGRSPQKTNKEDVMRMVHALGDITAVLGSADREDKAELYRGLGLRMRYHPVQNKVRAEIRLDPHREFNSSRGGRVRVRGGT